MGDWLLSTLSTTLATTALIGLALYMFRALITTRLTKSVQYEFDGKLALLRTDLTKSEDSFRADLRAKENQIAALQSGALTGLVSRQVALDKRRLEAVDQLWSAVNSLGPLKTASAVMASVKFEAAARESAKNPKLRQIFETMPPSIDPNKPPDDQSWRARPFVSPLAWALFAAYRSIIWLAVTQLSILRIGIDDAQELVDMKSVANLVKVALPHQSDYVEKYGPAAYHNLLDELEMLLLIELKRLLEGAESDVASVKKAAAILKAADSVKEEVSEKAEAQSGPAAAPVHEPAADGDPQAWS